MQGLYASWLIVSVLAVFSKMCSTLEAVTDANYVYVIDGETPSL